MKFAVLMTCFNRVETTLECLRHLFAARLPGGASFDVWLNDDGCTDGTGERVEKEFPAVKIIKGSGHDYWCGGMRRAWDAAAKHFDYDAYLWLNDDTMLNEDAFEVLLVPLTSQLQDQHFCLTQSPPSTQSNFNNDYILVGAVCGRDGKATYGGEKADGFYPPDGTWASIVQMNGNIVLVPRSVFRRLGNLPDYMTHSLGDSYYSRLAVKMGIPVLLSPAFIGVCEKNEKTPAWKREDVPLAKRLKSLYSPLGGSEPKVVFRYRAKMFGVTEAAKVVFSNHLRAVFPGLWRKMKG